MSTASQPDDEDCRGERTPASQPRWNASGATSHRFIVTDHSLSHPARAAAVEDVGSPRRGSPGDRSMPHAPLKGHREPGRSQKVWALLSVASYRARIQALMCDATVDGGRYGPTPRRQRGATAWHAACRWLEPGTSRDARVSLRSPSSPSPTPLRSRRTTSVRSRRSHPSGHIVVNGGHVSKVSTLRLVPGQSARSPRSRPPHWAVPLEGRARREPQLFVTARRLDVPLRDEDVDAAGRRAPLRTGGLS
jgi:hypothetical protein